jgi:TonB-linked SusC/RagA family outer membrane protein
MKKLLLFIYLLLGATFVYGQTKTVRGVVVDENDLPLGGVSVIVSGTTTGVSTDNSGNFQISVSGSATTLDVKLLGMNDLTIPIEDGLMRIKMTLSDIMLEEVVVQVAYGVSKRMALTGALTVISSKEIEQRPLTSVANAMEGKLGVMATSANGQPGSSPSVRIRGYSSVNGDNSPLYIIDGVSFAGSLSDINPQDIESMTLLKDASSAALYGNRAANGVILITTKRGKGDKPRISLTINQGITYRAVPEYDRLGADRWMESTWIAYRNQLLSTQQGMTVDAANAQTNQEIVSTYYKYNIYDKPDDQLFDANGKLLGTIRPGFRDDLDWFAEGIRNGYRQEYGLSGDGKMGSKADYYFSVNYLDEQGYAKNADFKRLSGRAKINVTPNSWFNTEINVFGTNQDISNMDVDGSGYLNLFSNARGMSPIYPIHLHDMTTGEYILDANGNKQYDNGVANARPQMTNRHTIWESELNSDITARKTLQGSLKTNITFLKDFVLTLSGDYNTRINENDIYDNAIIGDGYGNHGRAGYTDYRYVNYTLQEQLIWGRKFGIHEVDALVAHENYYDSYVYAYARKANEVFAGLPYLVNFTELTNMTSYEHNYRLESYFSRVRYNYGEKYFLDMSFRRDGSSRFYKNNRWGNFWSVGANWNISKEKFMESLKGKIDYLKLRANYGETGNDGSVGLYGYMALYGITQNGGNGALIKSQLEALDIQWEASTSFGVALEGRLFDKVNLTFEYFDKRSRDLLFDVTLPTSAGATSSGSTSPSVSKNIGSVANRGIEFSIEADLIKNKDFQWYLNFNGTSFKNKILTLPEENRENGIIDGTKKYTEGRGMYDFWTYQYAGVDLMSGRALYELNDKDYYIADRAEANELRTLVPAENTVRINDVDYVYKTTYAKRDFTGSATPKFSGGLNTGVSYKDISLDVLFTFAVGHKVMDNPYISLMSIAGTAPSSLHSDVSKSWNGVPEGITENSPNRIDKNAIPILDPTYSADVNATSTRFLINGSWLMLKNINLSYRFPKKWLKPLDLSGARINFTVENLWYLTARKGMNSQMSFNGIISSYASTPRIASVGLKVDF